MQFFFFFAVGVTELGGNGLGAKWYQKNASTILKNQGVESAYSSTKAVANKQNQKENMCGKGPHTNMALAGG